MVNQSLKPVVLGLKTADMPSVLGIFARILSVKSMIYCFNQLIFWNSNSGLNMELELVDVTLWSADILICSASLLLIYGVSVLWFSAHYDSLCSQLIRGFSIVYLDGKNANLSLDWGLIVYGLCLADLIFKSVRQSFCSTVMAILNWWMDGVIAWMAWCITVAVILAWSFMRISYFADFAICLAGSRVIWSGYIIDRCEYLDRKYWLADAAFRTAIILTCSGLLQLFYVVFECWSADRVWLWIKDIVDVHKLNLANTKVKLMSCYWCYSSWNASNDKGITLWYAVLDASKWIWLIAWLN